jgi:copper transporter 1
MDMGSEASPAVDIMMIPWLHFGGGDNLFFKSLYPSSPGALVGASIVLFLLAIFERWLSAVRVQMEAHWRERCVGALLHLIILNSLNPFRALAIVSPCPKKGTLLPPTDVTTESSTPSNTLSSEPRTPTSSAEKVGPPPLRRLRNFAPFIPMIDFGRGAVHALQTTLSYTLMLAIM